VTSTGNTIVATFLMASDTSVTCRVPGSAAWMGGHVGGEAVDDGPSSCSGCRMVTDGGTADEAGTAVDNCPTGGMSGRSSRWRLMEGIMMPGSEAMLSSRPCSTQLLQLWGEEGGASTLLVNYFVTSFESGLGYAAEKKAHLSVYFAAALELPARTGKYEQCEEESGRRAVQHSC
jgi:hypothetical protein